MGGPPGRSAVTRDGPPGGSIFRKSSLVEMVVSPSSATSCRRGDVSAPDFVDLNLECVFASPEERVWCRRYEPELRRDDIDCRHAHALSAGHRHPRADPLGEIEERPAVDLGAFARLETFGVERAFALFARQGFAGVKIDFIDSQSQEAVQWSQRTLESAARHHLLVDFHGMYKPTGLARTYPSLITQEGVLGNEYNKFDENKCTLRHTVTLPFTRALLGAMDRLLSPAVPAAGGISRP